MLARYAIPAALVALLAAIPVRAQEAPARIAICNANKVFEQMDERKAVEDRLRQAQDRLKAEAQRREMEVNELQRQMTELNPNSDQYREKSRARAQKIIEFRVWAEVAKAQLEREEKEQVVALYDKIRAATKKVAEARKIDLVLAERKPEIPQNMDQLTPQQVRQLISSTDTLYVNANADITEEVWKLINKEYATAPTPPAENK